MPADIETENGKIAVIRTYGEREADADYGEKRIVPGFIDLHTHGSYGYDTNDGTPEGLKDWMRRIPFLQKKSL